MILPLFLAFVFLSTWAGAPLAASPSSDLPALHRGVNVASWLANTAGRQGFYPRDFKRIKQEGFDFVRLPVNQNYSVFLSVVIQQ